MFFISEGMLTFGVGYGATTFPALTESITEDKSVTFAQHEAERLSRLFEALAEKIRP